MKDLHSNCLPVQAIAPAVVAASANGDSVDLQGFSGCEFALQVGVGGITFTGTNKIGYKMEESDDNSTFTAVDGSDIKGASGVTGGIVIEFTAAHAAATVHNFGYIGSKRYVRLNPVFSGTHGTGTAMAATAIKGFPAYAPAQ
jgi:hypothetical protein